MNNAGTVDALDKSFEIVSTIKRQIKKLNWVTSEGGMEIRMSVSCQHPIKRMAIFITQIFWNA